MHRRVHLVKQFRCTECDDSFHHSGTLTKHMNIAHNISVACKVCSKLFSTESSLKIHMICHSTFFPFSCLFCEKKFKTQNALLSHIRIHTNEKPYFCKICKNSFTTNTVLALHQSVHTQERPHKCQECSAAFRHKANLSRHIRSVHKNERLHACLICGKRFFAVQSRDAHTLIHINEEPHKQTSVDAPVFIEIRIYWKNITSKFMLDTTGTSLHVFSVVGSQMAEEIWKNILQRGTPTSDLTFVRVVPTHIILLGLSIFIGDCIASRLDPLRLGVRLVAKDIFPREI
ncbi:putative zinc finger protein [Orchesella cincta]|uniref:Putative zinc finger protein n=1 Tax=Orchesella cincta TaxID=48709 RepID=A0A1D2M3S5_ORCCI|nr:putative zinc finger protein [Orchesella cincta]